MTNHKSDNSALNYLADCVSGSVGGARSIKVVATDENGFVAGTSMGTLEAVMINAQTIGGGGTITGPSIEVDGYKRLTFLVTADVSTEAYVQVSNDGVSWYNPKTVADGDIKNACNNEKIAIPFNDHFASYVRLLVLNKAGGDAIVTAVLVAGG